MPPNPNPNPNPTPNPNPNPNPHQARLARAEAAATSLEAAYDVALGEVSRGKEKLAAAAEVRAKR